MQPKEAPSPDVSRLRLAGACSHVDVSYPLRVGSCPSRRSCIFDISRAQHPDSNNACLGDFGRSGGLVSCEECPGPGRSSKKNVHQKDCERCGHQQDTRKCRTNKSSPTQDTGGSRNGDSQNLGNLGTDTADSSDPIQMVSTAYMQTYHKFQTLFQPEGCSPQIFCFCRRSPNTVRSKSAHVLRAF